VPSPFRRTLPEFHVSCILPRHPFIVFLSPPSAPTHFRTCFCINLGVQGHGFASNFIFSFSLFFYDKCTSRVSAAINTDPPFSRVPAQHGDCPISRYCKKKKGKRDPLDFFVPQKRMVCLRVYRTSSQWSTGQARRQYARIFNYTGGRWVFLFFVSGKGIFTRCLRFLVSRVAGWILYHLSLSPETH
jgi:hypothetical protein